MEKPSATTEDIDIALENGLNVQAGPMHFSPRWALMWWGTDLAQLQAQDINGHYRPD